MKRFGLVGFAVAAAIGTAAAPAFAKGEGVPIFAKAVISGPGLRSPIVVSGKMHAFTEVYDSMADGLIVASGLGAGPEEGWYELPPDPGTLGPAYDVTYTFGGVEQFVTTVPLHQVVYPYAPGRPFVYTAPGQRFLGSKIGEWWSAPPSLRTFLISKGLPAAPVAALVHAQPRAVRELPGADAVPWAIVFVATALLAMVVTGAVAGRRAGVSEPSKRFSRSLP